MKIDVAEGFKKKNNFRRYDSVRSMAVLESKVENVWITIAIPTYKRGKLLKETIDSALFQSYEYSFEVIIVDNDSQMHTETEELIKSYNNPKLSYYKNSENLGLFGNWNRCFELARGEYVVLLHDDDFLLADFLSESMRILKRNADVAIFKPSMFQWHDTGENDFKLVEKKASKFPGLRFLRVKAFDYIFMGNYMEAPTGCIFKKSVVLEYGGFNIDLFPSADTLFLLHVSMENKVILYREFLGVKRLSDNESTKHETLEKFVFFRYYTIMYLINKYSLNKLYGLNYLSFSISQFLKSLKCISSDFVFCVEKFPLKTQNVGQRMYYAILITGYKAMKVLWNMIVKQIR